MQHLKGVKGRLSQPLVIDEAEDAAEGNVAMLFDVGAKRCAGFIENVGYRPVRKHVGEHVGAFRVIVEDELDGFSRRTGR